MDELVTELCIELVLDAINATDDEDEQEQIIAQAEHRASEINNQGEEAQLAFLRQHGWELT